MNSPVFFLFPFRYHYVLRSPLFSTIRALPAFHPSFSFSFPLRKVEHFLVQMLITIIPAWTVPSTWDNAQNHCYHNLFTNVVSVASSPSFPYTPLCFSRWTLSLCIVVWNRRENCLIIHAFIFYFAFLSCIKCFVKCSFFFLLSRIRKVELEFRLVKWFTIVH